MENCISVQGARVNNLKNISVEIPRDKLVVLTGLSGSGKSSLAFDTIFAEGQRRYVESLSSYARMFLGQMDKPDVDAIDGLSPAISIDQKTTSRNPRSTVGTVTEIYDYLRLLWARCGTPHCPKCGKEIRRQTIDQIVDQIMGLPERTKFQILSPVVRGKKGEHQKVFEDARRSGIIPRDADQYNAIQERLISRFSELYSREPFYFCCCQDTDEDRSTVLYLQDCAQQAGQESRFIYIEDLGLGVGGVLTDLDDNVIQRAFKLYPLEWMMRDDNGPLLRKRREQWVEPLWKSILSNKGLMPLLWRFFPGHPNLLASWFEGEKSQIAAGESYVRKPIYSREGGNVTIFDGQNNVVDHADGDYADEPMIYQAFQPLPRFGDSYTLIGSWIVDDEACGMGIREDNTLITKDTSRFVPHYIAG